MIFSIRDLAAACALVCFGVGLVALSQSFAALL
jgi:hypothetical protein